MQKKQSPNTPPSLLPLQEPSSRLQDHNAASTKQCKQQHGSEDDRPRPAKRPRINLQSTSDGSFSLTKLNLQKHNTLVMGSEADSARGRRRGKRSASRARTESIESESTPTEQTASMRSQKSSGTSANYRHAILSKAGIHVHHMPIPEEIRVQMDAIIQREVTPERKETLSCIAQQLSDSFGHLIIQASGEDDCIEPFYHALHSMDHSKSLAFQRKAGIVSLFYPCIPLCSLHFRLETMPQASCSASLLEF